MEPIEFDLSVDSVPTETDTADILDDFSASIDDEESGLSQYQKEIRQERKNVHKKEPVKDTSERDSITQVRERHHEALIKAKHTSENSIDSPLDSQTIEDIGTDHLNRLG